MNKSVRKEGPKDFEMFFYLVSSLVWELIRDERPVKGTDTGLVK